MRPIDFLTFERHSRVIERVTRERERATLNPWEQRERFAERVRKLDRRAANNPEEWIAEVLETEAILG